VFTIDQYNQAKDHLETFSKDHQGLTLNLSIKPQYSRKNLNPNFTKELTQFSTITQGQKSILYLNLNLQSNCCINSDNFDDFIESTPDSL
jgi:hypothetical protein